MIINSRWVTRVWGGVEGINIPGIYLCHLQNHNYCMRRSPPANLTFLRPSEREKTTLQRGAACFFQCTRLAPFCQSVLEEKLMPWPYVFPSHLFWETMQTASPHPHQFFWSVATAPCLLMKDPINRSLHSANTLS